ncbi:MAG: hypothetical protein B6241_10460 [Spirochaetaceae bacterium 4572_59]|nr:MAG: hypothetical protein B6241_10460 [Spirochaetaceae bacterium 4572_59]
MISTAFLASWPSTNKVFKNLNTPMGIPFYPGLHMEGPYFSFGQKGAQDEKYIKAPGASEYEEILQSSELISRWSMAPELLQLIYQIKGSATVSLVSDAIRTAGLGEGEFCMGSVQEGQMVIVEDGVAKLPDRSAVAGSVTMETSLLKVMYESSQASLEEVVRMMTVKPATILKLDNRKGTLSEGMDAVDSYHG